jgi:hypothetical protein
MYDSWSIQIKTAIDTINTKGQAAAVCLTKPYYYSSDVEYPGMQCIGVMARNSHIVDTSVTYWIPYYDAGWVTSLI